MISSYEKIETLGCGHYGQVWEVKHVESEKHFALKRANPDTDKGSKLLLNEIKILQVVQHKNIVKYIDSCISERIEENSVVTEFCDRGSLLRFIVSLVKFQFSEIVCQHQIVYCIVFLLF